MKAGGQVPFNFAEDLTPGFELYLPGPNPGAYQYLQGLVDSPAETCVYLWGASVSGKSHLLQAACKEAARRKRQAIYISLSSNEGLSPRVLDGLDVLDLVCLDDVDHLAGREDWELALFHLYNRLREAGAPLVLAGRAGPASLDIQLPDLGSRLRGALVFHLEPLGDQDKQRALEIRAKARGFELPAEVSGYLLRRMPRDMKALCALLDRLDHASLAMQRRLTIPFVRGLIDAGGQGD
jgi:DnaA family protein